MVETRRRGSPAVGRVPSILLLCANTEKKGPDHVSHNSIMMDRIGPLRYKDLVTIPNAMGAFLADALRTNNTEKINLIAEIISIGSAAKWYGAQS